MKKNFVFNSVRYDDIEGILCVELELKKTEKGDVFSASGVFRARNGRIESAGQILDGDFIFASKKDENLFLDIKRLWQLYHLNDCPDGVLCRPCPKCGKEYGRGWYFKEIPADDVEKIKLIMGA